MYPNWGFLRLKRTNYYSKRKERRADTPYQEVLGDTIKITNYGKKYATGVYIGGSRFYSPQQALNKALRERIKHELNFKPVINSASTLIPENGIALDPTSAKKMRAAVYIRDHWRINTFLLKMRNLLSRKIKLTDCQYDTILRIGEEIETNLIVR